MSMRRSRHWLRRMPISISTKLSQLACLGGVMELQPAQDAPRLRRGESLVKGARGVGGEIVQHDPDFLGLGEVHVGEFAHAQGEILRRAPIRDFHLAP